MIGNGRLAPFIKFGADMVSIAMQKKKRHAVAIIYVKSVEPISADNNTSFADIFTFGKSVAVKNASFAFARA